MSFDLVLNVLGCVAIATACLFVVLTALLSWLWQDDPARHAERDARE